MTTVCPICNSSAQALPRTGDATGFHCPIHGKFKVTDTISEAIIQMMTANAAAKMTMRNLLHMRFAPTQWKQ